MLQKARRAVVKLGTSTVIDEDGSLCPARVEPIVREVAALVTGGRQIILVSSGAVGLGRGWLGLHPSRLKDMTTKQACAAAGQSLLMEAYKRLFAAQGRKVAQVLLTEEDFSNWQRYSNLRRTMERLLSFGVVPIVNENDTVSTAELETLREPRRTAAFSDNDRLAALVMSGLNADALVLLTNVPGLMRASSASSTSPRTTAADARRAAVIPLVRAITPELRQLAAGPSADGRGGMRTKLEAAEIAMSCGGAAVIADGRKPGTLTGVFSGAAAGTVFLPSQRVQGKRRWLAYAAGVRGRVVVDAGAQRAIAQRKASLLASGVLRVEKPFGSMDVVSIAGPEGREFARGVANCASHEAILPAHDARSGAASNGSTAKRASNPVLFTRENIVLLADTP